MSRFYFDANDAEQLILDEIGEELKDRAAASRQAFAVLLALARSKHSHPDRRDFFVIVRDDRGNAVFTAAIALLGVWL